MQGIELCVAIQEDAIQVFPSSIIKGIKDIERKNAEHARKLAADPIIYTERYGMIIVLAQFGDFPNEQKLIELIQSDKVSFI